MAAPIVQNLTREQIAGITLDLSVLGDDSNFLQSLSVQQYGYLTASQVASMTLAQVQAIPVGGWYWISGDTLNAMSLDIFTRLCQGGEGNNPLILNISREGLANLDAQHFNQLASAVAGYTAEQVRSLKLKLFASFTTAQATQILNVIGNDPADALVLQVGLIKVLATIDGSNNGISNAIQTVLALRQTQSEMMTAYNLSIMIPALQGQYLDSQYFAGSILEQGRTNYWQYVFGNAVLGRLAASVGNLRTSFVEYQQYGVTLGVAFQRPGGFVSLDQSGIPMRAAVATLVYQELPNYLAGIGSANLSQLLRMNAGNIQQRVLVRLQAKVDANNLNRVGTGQDLDTVDKYFDRLQYAERVAYVKQAVGGFLDDEIGVQIQKSITSKSLQVRIGSIANNIALAGALLSSVGALISLVGSAINIDKNLSKDEQRTLLATAILGAISYAAQVVGASSLLISQVIINRLNGTAYTDVGLGEAIWSAFKYGLHSSILTEQIKRELLVGAVTQEDTIRVNPGRDTVDIGNRVTTVAEIENTLYGTVQNRGGLEAVTGRTALAAPSVDADTFSRLKDYVYAELLKATGVTDPNDAKTFYKVEYRYTAGDKVANRGDTRIAGYKQVGSNDLMLLIH